MSEMSSSTLRWTCFFGHILSAGSGKKSRRIHRAAFHISFCDNAVKILRHAITSGTGEELHAQAGTRENNKGRRHLRECVTSWGMARRDLAAAVGGAN